MWYGGENSVLQLEKKSWSWKFDHFDLIETDYLFMSFTKEEIPCMLGLGIYYLANEQS